MRNEKNKNKVTQPTTYKILYGLPRFIILNCNFRGLEGMLRM